MRGHTLGGKVAVETFLQYARRGQHAWWRYLFTVTAALLLAAVAGIVIGLTLTLSKLMTSAELGAALTSPSEPAKFFTATGLMFGLILLAFAAMIRVFHRKAALDALGGWRWRDYATGLLVWAVILIVLTAIDYAISPASFSLGDGRRAFAVAGWALVGLSVQTFAEEYFFRGYVTQGLLLALKNRFLTAAVSGLVFGVVHVPNGLPQAVAATALGAALALIAIRTGGLAWGAGLHLINNLFGAVIVVSTSDVFKGSPALIQQNSPHLMWWDTGAVVVASLLTAAAVERWHASRAEREPGAASAVAENS